MGQPLRPIPARPCRGNVRGRSKGSSIDGWGFVAIVLAVVCLGLAATGCIGTDSDGTGTDVETVGVEQSEPANDRGTVNVEETHDYSERRRRDRVHRAREHARQRGADGLPALDADRPRPGGPMLDEQRGPHGDRRPRRRRLRGGLLRREDREHRLLGSPNWGQHQREPAGPDANSRYAGPRRRVVPRLRGSGYIVGTVTFASWLALWVSLRFPVSSLPDGALEVPQRSTGRVGGCKLI